MKKFIKFAFVAAIAAVAGYNVYQSQSVMNGMSDFALANVEALADGEYSLDDLTITVNDIGKANNFLWYFMTRQESERKLIEEQIGFSLKSINFITKEEVIRRLKSQIDDYFNNLL